MIHGSSPVPSCLLLCAAVLAVSVVRPAANTQTVGDVADAVLAFEREIESAVVRGDLSLIHI